MTTTHPATLVAFLLDRTGSMESVKAQTIAGFNAYLAGLKAEGAGIEFSMIQFDSESIDVICANRPVAEVAPLTEATFQPRASTPLIDACVKVIRAVEVALAAREVTPKVVVTFQTDGEENASTEHGWDDLNALVKAKMALGWEFNFLGAGIDAYVQGGRMGLSPARVMSYGDAMHETVNAFSARAQRTMAFARSAAPSMEIEEAEKLEAGDRFAAGAGAGPAARPAGGATIDLTRRPAARAALGEIRL